MELVLNPNQQAVAYLVSAILFIFALKGLTHPKTARQGNWLGILGMIIALGATLLGEHVTTYWLIIVAGAIGAVIGIVVALKIKMADMPQLVAALHSFVGMAAVLVAIGTFITHANAGELNPVLMGELSAGIVIGAITFTGSVIAFAKLQGIMDGAPITFKGQHALNAALGIATVGLAVYFAMQGATDQPFAANVIIALIAMTLLAFRHRRQTLMRLITHSGGAGFTLPQPADHRRRPGGLLRRHPLLHHVPGDEPLHHQRGLRRLRHRRQRRRQRRRPGRIQGREVRLHR